MTTKSILTPVLLAAILAATGALAKKEAADATAAATPASTPAARAYERFKSLAGQWTGTSTAGWDGDIDLQVIAGGSALMETSHFEAHLGDTMVTMIHPDGERLLLTHYCVANNQPRLVASSIAEDVSAVTFTFLDGTNMKSRDVGHMDRVSYKFRGPDEFTSQWSFYKDGKETWMEEITYKRKTSAVTTPPTVGQP